MSRSNRAQRRRAQHGHRPGVVHRNEAAAVEIAPGLPGGPPYTPQALKDLIMEEQLEALMAVEPWMAQRAIDAKRWGIPAKARRLRHVREEIPGIGAGVLLGDFTNEFEPSPVSRLLLPKVPGTRRVAGRLIVPEGT